MSQTSENRPRYMPGLDGLRGIAILAVFAYHACTPITPVNGVERFVFAGTASSWAGVDLFFVLSGFLITGILIDTRRNEKYYLTFFARRTLRIFPLYFAVLALIFGVLPWLVPFDTPGLRRINDNQLWLWTYTTNIGFVWNAKAMFSSDWLGLNHFWSLAIEEQFYLVWPFVVYHFRGRRLVMVCVAAILSAITLRCILVALGMRPGAIYFPTPCRIDSLALGALLAIAVRTYGYTRQGIVLSRIVFVGIGGTAITWMAICGGLRTTDPVVQTVGYSLIAGIAAAAVYLVSTPEQTLLKWLLDWQLFRVLGKYSYGIYIFHHLLLVPLERYWPVEDMVKSVGTRAVGVVLYLLLGFCGSLFLAVGSWHFWEKWFLKLKSRFPTG